MKLNEIFYLEEEFMDWLANNCYSCGILGDGATQYNPYCEFEPIISYSGLNEEINENLTSIITEKGKLCKCKNFVMSTAKSLLLLMIILALTGCVSKAHKPKVYRRKIEFYKPKKLKVLYAAPEEENLPEECYKINFPDTAIAEMMLNTHKLRKINANTQKWILLARREIKKAHAELARRKAEIAKIQKQLQKIKEMRKELKQIEIRIEKAKKKRQEEKERRLRS
jgi:hypothetical protein